MDDSQEKLDLGTRRKRGEAVTIRYCDGDTTSVWEVQGGYVAQSTVDRVLDAIKAHLHCEVFEAVQAPECLHTMLPGYPKCEKLTGLWTTIDGFTILLGAAVQNQISIEHRPR